MARGIGNRDGVKNIDNVDEGLKQCSWRAHGQKLQEKRGKEFNYDPTHLISRPVRRGQLVRFSLLWG